MRKRILSILLTLCMLLCLVPTAVFAEGSTVPADITGTGTADDPYLIYTAQGLKTFRDITNGANGHTRNIKANATLMNDIVLNDGTFDENGNYTKGESGRDAEMWTPIASYDGTFDGGGYAIRGLYVDPDAPQIGLFGSISGIIRNLTVTGLVCSRQSTEIGGIAGEMYDGSIINCCNACIVVGNGYSSRIGGIVGYQTGGVISNCYNIGKVKAGKITGGIVGYQIKSVISNCYNTGTVTSGERIGGIAGYQEEGVIGNCYNIGSVKPDYDYFKYIGGIAGENFASTVTDCYYLTGTAEKSVGSENGEPAKRTEAKPKVAFADGTVLTLLQNGDANSPWEKCGYLNAAEMIVPLLKGQTSDTFPVYTAEDLKLFRDAVNGGNANINAKLMNDIVLNDGTFDADGNYTKGASGKDADMWMPINGYGGTFDGDGHTIQGVYVNYGGDAGLFSSASGATIKGLTITGYIKGKDRVGGIVGYMSSGTITGCRNAAVVRGEQSSYIACGGIAGRLTTGTIANCENVGSVQATLSGDGLEVGGIVGHAGSYNTSAIFEACANLGSVTAIVDDAGGYARVGGITGFVAQHVDLIDCYNAGSLLLTEQKGTPADSCLGGIFGCKFDGVYSSESELPSASNCYNVGTMTHTGNGKVAIGDIGGETPNIKIINCYGLTGKTKAEFADGTVLALLKGDRTDSPWAKTDYLKAAGMTLPLLSWQTADAHTHDYQWKYDNTEHWKECSCGFIEQGSNAAHSGTDDGDCTTAVECVCGYVTKAAETAHNWSAWTQNSGNDTHSHRCQNAGCTASETDNCSGGTATCTEQATCDVCHEKYGNKDPNNHTDTTEWVQTETKHTQKYKCCGAVTVAEEDHEWENGVCSECHYTCAHSGGTATCTDKATCEICGEKYGAVDSDNHTDITEWIQTATTHTQKYKCCGAVTVVEKDHEWENGVCTECGYGCRHDYEWQSENGQYWQKCKFCNHETAKKDIPTVNIGGADKVCRTQDYKFSLTLPEGATDAAYGYEFIGLGDGPLTPTVENNLYIGSIKASVYPAEESGFKLIVSAKTADGFTFSAEKTVKIQNEHSGGTATCKDKAVCEVCGERYGELDANNHADMKHFEAKAATKAAEGNIEYWYCEGCGKYFADKDGAKEITKADTVTAKLPDDSKSPQTGDNSNLTLWIALLFISGGAVTATTVYGRKKKRLTK